MRRYVFDDTEKIISSRHYDVIIAGAGLSGLYAALLLDESLSVAVLVKDRLQQCNSSLAQGGIAAVTLPADNTDKHLEDTLKAARGLAHEAHLRVMVEEGPHEIEYLASLGVPFDQDHNGRLYTTKEGGHTEKRVLHCGGDATGAHIITTLIRKVQAKPGVDILQNRFLLDVLTNSDKQACGITVWHQAPEVLWAPHIIVATGGIGQTYHNTTNQPGITGDGIAAAIRAGARTKHMEFVQFHPTAFFDIQKHKTAFLISEAVRGEGGILRNHKGEPFMEKYHPMKDLAPRDSVSQAISREMKNAGTPYVFLDVTMHSKAFLSQRFPTIYGNCRDHGIDMATHPVPVAPSQHYIMGGIQTDSYGRSHVEGLYVCGEAACTGVHGANRLASNSLLECLVFSRRCATHINRNKARHSPDEAMPAKESKPGLQVDVMALRSKIKTLMQTHGGIVRDDKGLAHAIATIRKMTEPLHHAGLSTKAEVETYNMGQIALEVLNAALQRTKSVGAHYRSDQE